MSGTYCTLLLFFHVGVGVGWGGRWAVFFAFNTTCELGAEPRLSFLKFPAYYRMLLDLGYIVLASGSVA